MSAACTKFRQRQCTLPLPCHGFLSVLAALHRCSSPCTSASKDVRCILRYFHCDRVGQVGTTAWCNFRTTPTSPAQHCTAPSALWPAQRTLPACNVVGGWMYTATAGNLALPLAAACADSQLVCTGASRAWMEASCTLGRLVRCLRPSSLRWRFTLAVQCISSACIASNSEGGHRVHPASRAHGPHGIACFQAGVGVC